MPDKREQGYWRKRFEKLRDENQTLKKKMTAIRQTHRERLKSLQNREKLLDVLSFGLILVQQGKIIDINQRALDQFGYRAEEIKGRDLLELVPFHLKKHIKDLFLEGVSGKPIPDQYETVLVSKNGVPIKCDVKANKFRFNGRTAFLLSLSSLDKRKKREEDLIISKKMEALVMMAEGLTRTFSRGLRHLLNSIEVLKGESSPENRLIKKGLKEAGETAEQLLGISEDLEQFSRPVLDPSRVRFFDLKEVVKAAVTSISPKLKVMPENRGVKINLKTYLRPVSPVRGDPAEIREMLTQVIQNGIDAMPDGGSLYVSIEENAGQAYIYIQDSGQGLPEKITEYIFDPFFTTRGDERTGLGLSLAYVTLKRHHGEIEIAGNRTQGATMTIKLPLESKGHGQMTGAKKRGIKHAHILIIEDEDMVRGLMLQILGKKGYRIDTVDSGLEGLDKLKKKKVDMVIADSKALGIKVSVFVQRARKFARHLSIALITEQEGVYGPDALEKNEVDLILRKPLEMNRVVRQIHEILMLKAMEAGV